MAFMAKDGTKSTNRAPMMAHNRSMERKQSQGAGVMERTDPLAQPGEPDGDEQDGAAIAQEHGPAHEVNMTHDHEAGMHHVHSMHPDGHEHHSDHQSAEMAHEHGKKLAGGGMQEKQPDGDEGMGPEFE